MHGDSSIVFLNMHDLDFSDNVMRSSGIHREEIHVCRFSPDNTVRNTVPTAL